MLYIFKDKDLKRHLTFQVCYMRRQSATTQHNQPHKGAGTNELRDFFVRDSFARLERLGCVAVVV